MKSTSGTKGPGGDARFLLWLRLLFAAFFIAAGLYFEWGSAVATLCLTLLLIWYGRRGGLKLQWSPSWIAVLVLTGAYLLSSLWAADRGLAPWGFVKLLPLVPFALCCMQAGSDGRQRLLEDLPAIGGVMTVLSFLLQFIPALQRSFSIAGRLGGFFQYPNTFACFLLLGLAVLLCRAQREKRDWLWAALLVFGLLQAGSRTVIVLAVPVLLAGLLLHHDRVRLLLPMAGGGAAATGVLALLRIGAAGRVLEITPSASTFLGRLLYWKDALPVILRHPFGLGYLGYYFTQGSFQTGFYSVRWVHNDLLQLMLDVGWIPALLTAGVILYSLFSRSGSRMTRLVGLTLCAHAMLDFDLAFISMWLVLLLCLDWEGGKTARVKRGAARALAAAGIVLCALSVWIGAASALSYASRYQAALALYPWDTFSAVRAITECTDADALDAMANDVLKRNDHLAVVWDAKARTAFSNGDVASMMEYKRRSITCAPYALEEYVDSFVMLSQAAEAYANAGDMASAMVCISEIRQLQPQLDTVRARTDPLAWRLTETPQLDMPEEYAQYLAQAAE